MIILDSEEQERSKLLNDPFFEGPTLRFPEKAVARSDSPLPDYETSEARQKLIIKELSARPKSVETRLWRAILYSFGIYVLLTIAIAIPIIVVKKRDSHQPVPVNFSPDWDNNEPNNSNSLGATTNTWDIVEDARCTWDTFNSADSPGFTAHAEHMLNYSGSFYIQSNISSVLSNNNYSTGNFTVDLNPDSSVSTVLFTVDVEASSDDLLRHATACFIDSGSDRGVFLYVTRPLTGMDFVAVNIRVLLPQKASSTILDNFITNLPWFSHTFGNLKNHTIKNISLTSAGYDVVVDASTIYVKNTYASIIGNYHATSSLTLDGIKGNIAANVTLEQLSSSTAPTSLLLDTGDGSINAKVSLIAPSKARPHSSPYKFTADVRTFNGPVTFQASYTNSTPPTALQLSVSNTDGQTDVSLDKSYEGTFSVQSKLGNVTVRKPYLSPALDPLREKRQYSYQSQQVGDHQITGWVGWGKPPNYSESANQGQVKITTSLSPITLQLASS
ncbi:hypothetical protein H0H93_008412 [Arthromyces matolae]|nr:hypothetical protein H0H93_008412 [Arthromyces matolae]